MVRPDDSYWRLLLFTHSQTYNTLFTFSKNEEKPLISWQATNMPSALSPFLKVRASGLCGWSSSCGANPAVRHILRGSSPNFCLAQCRARLPPPPHTTTYIIHNYGRISVAWDHHGSEQRHVPL